MFATHTQGRVRHSANRTWKVNYNSFDPWCRQIPVPDRLFIPSPCHNFGCVSSEILVDSHIRELRNRVISAASLSINDVDLHNLLKEGLCISIRKSFLQNEKWTNSVASSFNSDRTLRMKTFRKHDTTLRHPSGNVCGWWAGDWHVAIGPFWIIILARLTAGVCMKVRFKSKVARGFSFSPSVFAGSRKEGNQEKPLVPGCLRLWYQNNFARAYLVWLNKNKSMRWSRRQALHFRSSSNIA